MDPFNMPDINAPVNYTANLGSALNNVAPLATTFHGSQTGATIQQVFNTPAAPKSPSVLSQFANKIGALGSESAHIVEGATGWLVHQGEQMVSGVVHFPMDAAKFTKDAYDTYAFRNQQNELTQRMTSLTAMWKSGLVNDQMFRSEMQQINGDSVKLTSDNSSLQTRLANDGGALVNSTIQTTSAILTVMTAGMGSPAVAATLGPGEKLAANYLAGNTVSDAMKAGEQAIGKLATSKLAFQGTSNAAQSSVRNTILKTLVGAAPDMTAAQTARAATSHLLLTYPLTYNAISSTGQQIYTELQNKKYGDAVNTIAFNAALLLSGGPIGWALKQGGRAIGVAKNAVFGQTSFLDTLSGLIGDKSPAGLYNVIKDNPELAKSFSALEATNVAAENGNVTKAAYRIIGGLTNAGWGDVSSLTHEEFVNQVHNWATAQQTLTEHLISKGMTAEQASRYVVGRWTVHDANFIAAELTKGGSQAPEDLLSNWNSLKDAHPNASWANNQNLDKEITSIVQSGKSATGISNAIRGIEAQFGIEGVSKSVSGKLSKLGFVGIEPVNLEAPFKTGGALKTAFAEGADKQFFLKTVQPLPVLGSIGDVLTKVGLSPDAATQRVYEVFSRNLADNIEKTDIKVSVGGLTKEENAQYITKNLADYVHGMKVSIKSPPITDYRQLTLGDIQKALNTTKKDAVDIRAAIMDAMLQVPLSVRGLGDRIADLNYKLNPAAGAYARLQGALRYAWNPFFQARLSYKAEFLAQIEAGGKFPTIAGTNKMLQIIMPEKYAQLDSIGKMLESNGVFGAGYAAEGADEAAAGYHALGHALLPGQKRSIAGLVSVMADRAGMTAEQFVTAFPNETKDTVRMILQYDPRANFLNSPLARTLNFAFFPFRFNLKVTTIMARSLAKQPLGVQFAVVKGVMNAHQFLNSAEGQAWYSKNADVIGLFKYFSPLETLSSIAQALGAKPGNIAAYGELGGLPFGWIPGLLNAEGIINTSTPYVNPTTGAIAQQYVPISMRGRAQAAIEDFIGSLFTYPGSTVGLPSKTSLDVKIAQGLVPGGSTKQDFQKITPQITPQQQQFQQVVQQVHGIQPPTTNLPQNVTQGLQPGINVPAQPTPITNPLPRSTGAKKLKKSQFKPELLPGQQVLGQAP